MKMKTATRKRNIMGKEERGEEKRRNARKEVVKGK